MTEEEEEEEEEQVVLICAQVTNSVNTRRVGDGEHRSEGKRCPLGVVSLVRY